MAATATYICDFSLCSIGYRRYCMHGLWLLRRRLAPAVCALPLPRLLVARFASASSKSSPTPAPEFSCVILGRPNVGKSTLFNRLVGRRQSLVYNVPGVTRDAVVAPASIADMTFSLCDTAGLAEGAQQMFEGPNHWASMGAEARNKTLLPRALAQSKDMAQRADVLLFVVDARAGITPEDRHHARWVHALKRPTVLLANKSEGLRDLDAECWQLGFGEALAVSAEHGEGLGQLYSALQPYRRAQPDATQPAQHDQPADSSHPPRAIRVAVIGRPNVGKSTFVNAASEGSRQLLVGPEPGITRDCIDVPVVRNGRSFVFVDTAGVRRKAKVESFGDAVEQIASWHSIATLSTCDVVVLMLDGNEPGVVRQQDLALMQVAIDKGKPVMFAINKTDCIPAAERGPVLRHLMKQLSESISQLGGITTVSLSALENRGVDRVLDAAADLHAKACSKHSTQQLNAWLEDWRRAHTPTPGRGTRLKYVVQTGSSPPTFLLFCTRAANLTPPRLREIANAMRERFGLQGVPINLVPKEG